ncbi:hypothetical protein DEU56DRAFT_920171 [Suillus clintonianus]|uniref:uncharacterized protein n=1 Tax=Suillus clintonianus TaxID=1904413 RepID=UPI001B8749F4|nr:uncharacterized protein DEU56DRAFT_920171 [Suillus clintonianus]KAG2110490.1 hypothetical protein DEU56DRAFT_920171 [Suillus clintonianus]
MDASSYWQLSNSEDELNDNSYPPYDVQTTNFVSGSSSNSQGLNYTQVHQPLPPPAAQPDQEGYNYAPFSYDYSLQFPSHHRPMTILPTHPESGNHPLFNLFNSPYGDAPPPSNLLAEDEAYHPPNDAPTHDTFAHDPPTYNATPHQTIVSEEGSEIKKGKQPCVIQNPHKLAPFDPDTINVYKNILDALYSEILHHAVGITPFLDQRAREALVKEKLKELAIASFQLNSEDQTDIGRYKIYSQFDITNVMFGEGIQGSSESNVTCHAEMQEPSEIPLHTRDFTQRKVRELIRKPQQEMDLEDTHSIVSLLFIFDKHSSPFEHQVIWDIVLETISQLDLTQFTSPGF